MLNKSRRSMGLAARCPRFIHRTVVAVAVLLIVTTFISKSHNFPTGNSTTQHSLLSKVWTGASVTLGSLFPRPYKESRHDTLGTVTPKSNDRDLMNATFISLVRNTELDGMLRSIQDVEVRFNHAYHYDWVFLNDEDFTEAFKTAITAAVSGRARYGKVSTDHWSYPTGVDQQFAEKARQHMADDPTVIPHAASESYRHMCRFQSGFFYRHPLVLEYEWYWRVEPNIELFCDIPSDPFRYLAENRKKYGFVISLNELSGTVHSLWTHVTAFMKEYPQHLSNNSHLAFLSEDGGRTTNYCHFWDNFEIASLDWFRSEAYMDFFTYLDSTGGFFYERWGDASVHSIAAALMLDKGDIHFFDDIGYHHYPLMSCPRSANKRAKLNCRCQENDNMDWNPSCTKRFFEVAGIEFPEGHSRDFPPEPGLLH